MSEKWGQMALEREREGETEKEGGGEREEVCVGETEKGGERLSPGLLPGCTHLEDALL